MVIVDVDEASLEAIGQWPWPRDIMSSLITQLRASGAAVVALDIMFAEPDRRSESAEGGDEALAASLSQDAVALGYALTFDAPNTVAAARPCAAHPAAVAIVHPDDDDPGEPVLPGISSHLQYRHSHDGGIRVGVPQRRTGY